MIYRLYVERNLFPFSSNQNCCLFQRVRIADFIKYVGIPARDVGDDNVTVFNLLSDYSDDILVVFDIVCSLDNEF